MRTMVCTLSDHVIIPIHFPLHGFVCLLAEFYRMYILLSEKKFGCEFFDGCLFYKKIVISTGVCFLIGLCFQTNVYFLADFKWLLSTACSCRLINWLVERQVHAEMFLASCMCKKHLYISLKFIHISSGNCRCQSIWAVGEKASVLPKCCFSQH